MDIVTYALPDGSAAEVTGPAVLFRSERDGIALLEAMHEHGASCAIVRREQFAPEFFDLSSGLAGAFLQKFSTYRVRLAIVGDFSQVSSRALNAFIYESNRQGEVLFVPSLEEALQRLASGR